MPPLMKNDPRVVCRHPELALNFCRLGMAATLYAQVKLVLQDRNPYEGFLIIQAIHGSRHATACDHEQVARDPCSKQAGIELQLLSAIIIEFTDLPRYRWAGLRIIVASHDATQKGTENKAEHRPCVLPNFTC